MNSVSDHAAGRLDHRVGKKARRRAEQFFHCLWNQGHFAHETDFIEFDTYRHDGRSYRVVVRGLLKYLVVRDTLTGQFVTIIRQKR